MANSNCMQKELGKEVTSFCTRVCKSAPIPTNAENCDSKDESACIKECHEKSGTKQVNSSTVQKGEEPKYSAQGTTIMAPPADTKNVEKERALKFKYKSIKDKITGALKFCAYGVKGKIKSFNLYGTKVDKNHILLRKQQTIDPFVQAVKYFVTHKIGIGT